jgi:hypothetical protein
MLHTTQFRVALLMVHLLFAIERKRKKQTAIGLLDAKPTGYLAPEMDVICGTEAAF